MMDSLGDLSCDSDEEECAPKTSLDSPVWERDAAHGAGKERCAATAARPRAATAQRTATPPRDDAQAAAGSTSPSLAAMRPPRLTFSALPDIKPFAEATVPSEQELRAAVNGLTWRLGCEISAQRLCLLLAMEHNWRLGKAARGQVSTMVQELHRLEDSATTRKKTIRLAAAGCTPTTVFEIPGRRSSLTFYSDCAEDDDAQE